MAESDDAFRALKPRRILPYETGEDGRVVVLRPKILGARWRWLLRLVRKPDYRVKLDERGSFVWLQCDGARTIAAIAAATERQFQDPPEDSGRRTALFLGELVRGGFLALDPGSGHGD
jgi:hypothetical protein